MERAASGDLREIRADEKRRLVGPRSRGDAKKFFSGPCVDHGASRVVPSRLFALYPPHEGLDVSTFAPRFTITNRITAAPERVNANETGCS